MITFLDFMEQVPKRIPQLYQMISNLTRHLHPDDEDHDFFVSLEKQLIALNHKILERNRHAKQTPDEKRQSRLSQKLDGALSGLLLASDKTAKRLSQMKQDQ